MNAIIAKVFTSGNSQAIRLPKQLRLNTDEVFIYQDDGKLVVMPKMNSWEGFEEGLSGFSDDFSVVEDLPADIPRKGFD